MNLEEFYAQIGGDYADTLQRLCNENMVKKFVKKYQDDPTCADLHNAVEQQDWEAAFRGAPFLPLHRQSRRLRSKRRSRP